MLEKLLNLHRVALCSSNSGAPLLYHQSVRWRRPRKPFWLGIAKSKMFVVIERKDNKTPEEAAEHQRLMSEYNTYLNSLYKFIKEGNPLIHERLAAQAVNSSQQMEIKRQFDESYERNLQWNAETAKLREVRLEARAKEMEQTYLEKLDTITKKKEELNKKVQDIIEIQKVASKSYITPENLEEAIEKCLSTVVDYNYAIDLEGNKITSFSQPTTKVETIKLDSAIKD